MKNTAFLIIFLFFANYFTYSQSITADTTRAGEMYQTAYTALKNREFEKLNQLIEQFTETGKIFKQHQIWGRYLQTQCGLVECHARNQNLPKTQSVANEIIELSKRHFGDENAYIGTAYHNIGLCYYYQENLNPALQNFQKGLEFRRAFFGEEHPETAWSYNNVGLVYMSKGNVDLSLSNLLKALEIREKVLPENHVDLLSSYYNIGNLYYEMDDLENSIKYYQKGLQLQLILYGEKNADVAGIYLSIGLQYKRLGKYNEAVENLTKALEIKKQLYGENNEEVASLYFFIGNTYRHLQQYEDALTNLNKAIEIQLVIFDEKHQDVANSYAVTGQVYLSMMEYDKALEYLNKGAIIQKALTGENNPTVASIYSDMAVAYTEMSQYDEAEDYLFKALEIRKELYGRYHEKTANSYNNIGLFYSDISEYDKAVSNLLVALDIREQVFGNNSAEAAETYNNIGTVYADKDLYFKALKYYQKALIIQNEVYGYWHTDVAASYDNTGIVYDKMSEYDKALENYEKALEIRLKLVGQNHPLTANSYTNIGTVYKMKNEYDTALDYFSKSLTVFRNVFGEQHENVAVVYENTGLVYYELSQLEKALEYQLKALEIRRNIFGENHIETADSYKNIGGIYYRNGQYKKAIEYFEKALRIQKPLLGEKHTSIAALYENIGVAYSDINEYDKAEENLLNALKIKKEIVGEQTILVATSYSNLATVYDDKGEHQRALDYHIKALEIRKDVLGEKHRDVASSYLNIASNYFQSSANLNKTLHYYHLAMVACMRDFSDTTDVTRVPAMQNYVEPFTLLKVLSRKALVLLLKGPEYYQVALQHYQAADTLITQTRYEIATEADKLALGQRADEVYDMAISAAFLLAAYQPNKAAYYNEQAFYFLERTKATVLLESLAGANALRFGGIPDNLLQEETNLRNTIALYQKLLIKQQDSLQQALLQNKLFAARQSHDSLISVFEDQYPKYYNLKYNNQQVALNDLQSVLDENTVLLNYRLENDTTIIVFVVSHNGLQVHTTHTARDSQGIENDMYMLEIPLSDPDPRYYRAYTKPAAKFYELLFPFELDESVENLIIVPDGVLSTIPFEALLTEKVTESNPDFSTLPYLIRDYTISYAYSATLFYRTFYEKTETPRAPYDFLALAPVFDNQNTAGLTRRTRQLYEELAVAGDSVHRAFSLTGEYINPLPGTLTEVTTIYEAFENQNFSALLKTHQQANEAFVKSGELKNYHYLHFATHGRANMDHPELSSIFLAQDTTNQEDGMLYIGEMYGLELNAALTVLSACQTGVGKIEQGEGIIGLSRALLYAGTQNLIVSLWRVKDASTKQLMINFYTQLLNNTQAETYRQQLHQAKLELINSPHYAHPHFWSPFILVGQ